MTNTLPDPIRKLADALKELPGIGPRQAIRLAIFLAAQNGAVRSLLADGLSALEGVKLCSRCYFFHQESGDLCRICSDASRERGIIMIVERETDLISLENTGTFNGRYLILGPVPKIGTLADWQKDRLATLRTSIQKEPGGQAREIILGFNPTSVGDFNTTLIQKELAGLAKKISRLGRGLPTGGEIEFADDETLKSALEGRG
ncbi:MAG: Recombinational repair protein recombination protein RecR [Candidatus Parcubacteria bacterium]|jgi:recombination protein RecR